MDTYNFCDSVWKFELKDVTLTVDREQKVQVGSAKIVCCDEKLAS
jgi:hypothetical protein